MDSIQSMANNQSASSNANNNDSDKVIFINATRINNTTSPEEKNHGSMHYTVTCPIKEILNPELGLDNNLRDDYGSEDSIKNPTAVHREIRASFEEIPSRFIQRNSGFTVVCSAIEVPQTKEFGINKITLTNASIINGAQTKGILKNIQRDYENQFDNVNVRVEILVEKNALEVTEIAKARNTSTNVSVLSRMGAEGKFKTLQENMFDKFGEKDGKIQISETDMAIPTQTLLQVIKAMTPSDFEDQYKKSVLKPSAVTSYSSKAGVTSEFRRLTDDPKKYEDILNYFHTFSGNAWEEYLSWTSDKLWLKHIEKIPTIGKYNKEKDEVSMQWGIICPTLYGLKSFLVESTGKWAIKYPENFDKKAYIHEIIEMFKETEIGTNLQTFGKSRSVYERLDNINLRKYRI